MKRGVTSGLCRVDPRTQCVTAVGSKLLALVLIAGAKARTILAGCGTTEVVP
jgi:hypothetical protein